MTGGAVVDNRFFGIFCETTGGILAMVTYAAAIFILMSSVGKEGGFSCPVGFEDNLCRSIRTLVGDGGCAACLPALLAELTDGYGIIGLVQFLHQAVIQTFCREIPDRKKQCEEEGGKADKLERPSVSIWFYRQVDLHNVSFANSIDFIPAKL